MCMMGTVNAVTEDHLIIGLHHVQEMRHYDEKHEWADLLYYSCLWPPLPRHAVPAESILVIKS